MGLGVLPGAIRGLTSHVFGQKLKLLVVHVLSTKRHHCRRRHRRHRRHYRRRRRRHRRRPLMVGCCRPPSTKRAQP